MKSPLQSLGYNMLTASLGNDTDYAKLSRRGFLALSASLASCSAAAPLRDTPAPVKTKPNPTYRTPPVQGPGLRNPDQNLPSKFTKNGNISFSRVHVSGNYIAMTFDDGPHPQNTPRLLDMLSARNIKATFYVIGQSVNLYPQIVRRTVAEGHEIGNHTNSHRLLSKLGNDDVRSEVGRCRDAIVNAAGVSPRTLRPPYGGMLQAQREMIFEEFGTPIILWSVDPLDWKRPGPSVVSSRIIAGASAGGIVLSHDLHGQTVDAMPATLDALLRKGFQFVTVSQLLAMRTEPETAAHPAAAGAAAAEPTTGGEGPAN
jgi:peptidoglycan/xylan/chitin deacetylase (PgdA/CDA1 family)